MAVPIMVPSSGELGAEVTLVRWLARPGDEVVSGAPLAEIEAEKGVLEIEAPAPGTVLITSVSVGSTVAPGTILGYLGRAGETVPEPTGLDDGSAPSAAASSTAVPAHFGAASASAGPAPAAGTPAARVPAAPATRRRAAALGVDLAAVVPTGAGASPGNTDRVVTLQDVEAAAAADHAPVQTGRGGVTRHHSPARRLPPNQRAVAAQVIRSHREIPPAHFSATVDARRAVALNAQGIGYTALFVHAAARALERFPRFRDTLRGEELFTSVGVHVAFAVGLEAEGELYTPVVRDAADLSLQALTARVRGLTEAVRARSLPPDDFRGACFLVTNLGAFGVEAFAPVIQPGHSAALAVGAVRRQPVSVQEGGAWKLEFRPTLTLTLAVDHRLINGIESARALSFIRDVVERVHEGRT